MFIHRPDVIKTVGRTKDVTKEELGRRRDAQSRSPASRTFGKLIQTSMLCGWWRGLVFVYSFEYLDDPPRCRDRFSHAADTKLIQ